MSNSRWLRMSSGIAFGVLPGVIIPTLLNFHFISGLFFMIGMCLIFGGLFAHISFFDGESR
jgi:hypothetical protein